MCSSFNIYCSLPPKQLSAAVVPLVSVMTVAREVAVNVFARAVTEHPATVETSANARKDAASILHAVSSPCFYRFCMDCSTSYDYINPLILQSTYSFAPLHGCLYCWACLSLSS